MLLVVVAVALLNEKGQVLLAKRTEQQRFAGMWEFPGGKVRYLMPQLENDQCKTVSQDEASRHHPYQKRYGTLVHQLLSGFGNLCRSREGSVRSTIKCG